MSKNRITGYFESVSKKIKIQSNDEPKEKIPETSDTNESETSTSKNKPISLEPSQSEILNDCESDIGHFVSQNNTVNDYLKSVILQRSNIPNDDFLYPFSIHIKKGKIEK